MLRSVLERAGRLDVLVNNASNFYPTPIGTISPAQWQDLMGTNLKAPLFLSQAAAPFLKRANGSIINMIDIHAQRPLRHHPVYSAAKAVVTVVVTAVLDRRVERRPVSGDLTVDVGAASASRGGVLDDQDRAALTWNVSLRAFVEGQVRGARIVAGAERTATHAGNPAIGTQRTIDATRDDEPGALADIPSGLG